PRINEPIIRQSLSEFPITTVHTDPEDKKLERLDNTDQTDGNGTIASNVTAANSTTQQLNLTKSSNIPEGNSALESIHNRVICKKECGGKVHCLVRWTDTWIPSNQLTITNDLI
ncbi:hypothetical protein MMC14_010803, partial [Varicellaria rhodocarpa]|nr:hypothetical protein [Varicellaria rhodocarpa]